MLHGGEQTTILFGAGIGRPAGLPTAIGLISEIASVVVLDERWQRALVEAMQPHGPLRFETAMELLSETVDDDLGVLGLFDEAQPGPLHEALANVAQTGARLLTVNFDDLVERVLARRKANPWTVDLHGNGSAPPDDSVPVFKLHGTRRVHRRARVEEPEQPLQATISEIVKHGGGHGFAEQAIDRLREEIDSQHLIVLGYSGSDDLDLMPALQLLQPREVTWVDHRQGAEPHPLPLSEGTPGSGQLLECYDRRGVAVSRLGADTLPLLASWGWCSGAMLSDDEWARRDQAWRNSAARWAEGVREQDPTGNGWVGLALGSLGRRDEAYEAIVASLPSPLPNGLWRKQRRLYEIAQHRFLLPDCDLALVRQEAAESIAVAQQVGDWRGVADGEMLTARAWLLEDSDQAAERALQSADKALDEAEKGTRREGFGRMYLALGRARLHIFRYQWDEARAAADGAARWGRELGAWAELSEALQLRSQTDWGAGQSDDGRAFLDEAVEIARTGPYPDQLNSALSRRAAINFQEGMVEEALEDAREAVALAQQHNLTSETYQELGTLGVAANELGLHEEARRAFQSALHYYGASSAGWGPDIVLGLADTLLQLGEEEQALDVLERYAGIVADNRWDVAHAAALRWAAGVASADEADEAIAAALNDAGPPFRRQGMCLFRLKVPGSATEELRQRVFGS